MNPTASPTATPTATRTATRTATAAARPHLLPLLGLLAFAAVAFGTGLGWGLPSRDADPFLFGPRTPWTGAQVMALAGPWSPAGDRGSDRPQHPMSPSVGPTTRATVLNATDADRAEIVRRYRLYSCQPDEMITFRSLSRMRPSAGDLDPRLYQYGGLWIYPVGGLLRLSAAAHLLALGTDLAYYLDHPDAFARFYVVARLYSAAWGLAGVAVVYGLTLELTEATEPGGSAAGSPNAVGKPAAEPPGSVFDRRIAAAVAAGIYVAMPVVVNAAHEAKPHLAGTVLTLATVWAAARSARTGRGWVFVAVLAGAASGMILTGVAAWAVLPVLAWRRPKRLAAMAAVAGLTFAVTNPYLPFDALFHRERLASNVGNYASFYGPSLAPATLWNAARLWVLGTSPVPAAVAVIGCGLLARPGRGRGWVLLAAPAAFVAVQFALLAAAKPAEYARFALTLDVAAAVVAGATITGLPLLRPREAALAGWLVVACTALYGMRTDINCLADTRDTSTRRTVARRLQSQATPGRSLVVAADPAPYGLPPVDLFAWRIVLVPRGERAAGVGPDALAVGFTDATRTGLASPISWANKPFDITPVAARP